MKINPAPFHLAQAIIVGLCVVLSIAVLGTSAHTLDVYNKQKASNPWWLFLWPQHYDVHGTQALVGASVSTFVLSTIFLVLAKAPSITLTPTMRALLGLATTLPSTLITFVTVIYCHILNNNAPEIDTIQTWTCKYKNSSPVDSQPEMDNGNFKSLCMESRFALYATLIIFLLLGLSLGLTVVTWLADKWAARSSRKEVEMTTQQS